MAELVIALPHGRSVHYIKPLMSYEHPIRSLCDEMYVCGYNAPPLTLTIAVVSGKGSRPDGVMWFMSSKAVI